MSDIKKLTDRIQKFRDDRDWAQFHKPKDISMAIAIEAGELMELFLWKTNEEIEEYLKTHREEVADELSDIIYNSLLFAIALDLDVVDAFEKKMQKNEAKYPIEKAKGSAKKYTEL